MKILNIRRGFASDHSSTSYEFLAVDKPLGKKERAEVAGLSSRANPSTRRVRFMYNVDGYDIPGGWEKLMTQYYDVMYSEEYDWWTLAMAFNADDRQHQTLRAYEFDGTDDLGVRVAKHGDRVIISIHCVVDMGDFGYDDYYHDEDEDDDETNDDLVASDDELLNILVEIRQQIMTGDYRALYAAREVYGNKDDEESQIPPKPEQKNEGKAIISQFKKMLTTI